MLESMCVQSPEQMDVDLEKRVSFTLCHNYQSATETEISKLPHERILPKLKLLSQLVKQLQFYHFINQ